LLQGLSFVLFVSCGGALPARAMRWYVCFFPCFEFLVLHNKKRRRGYPAALYVYDFR